MTKSKGKERYVWLRYWLLDSPAWKSLPVGARALYIEIARRYNGNNNGCIPYSVREAVDALRIGKSTVARLLVILQTRGFIVCTRKGAFSLKTTKDASEWRLTEYDSDAPVAHASKDFMRWQPPEGVDIDLNRQPSHHRKSKTRVPQRDHTIPVVGPHGTCGGTVKPKKRRKGTCGGTIKAKNAPSTVPPAGHLQLPGRGREPGVRDFPSFPEGEPAETKPWSTPTVEEIPWGTLPTDPVLVEGSKEDAGLPPPVVAKQSDAVADVLNQAGKAPAPANVIDEAVSAPDPVPARPMLPGDRRRAEQLIRNQEALRRAEAELRGRQR